MRGLTRFVEDLLRGRRPKPVRLDEQDAEALRVAIELSAARPGADVPRPEFIAGLHHRLSEALDAPTAPASEVSPAWPARRPALYTRRWVLGGASLAAAAAAVGGLVGAGLDHILTGRSKGQVGPSPQAVLTPNIGIWQTVATAADLPEGGLRAFDTGTVTGFVLRQPGRLAAVSGVCTHQGCRLAWDAPTGQLRCPCHRAAFALSGEVVQYQFATPPPPLPHLEVRQEGGAIQVFVPPQTGVTPPAT